MLCRPRFQSHYHDLPMTRLLRKTSKKNGLRGKRLGLSEKTVPSIPTVGFLLQHVPTDGNVLTSHMLATKVLIE